MEIKSVYLDDYVVYLVGFFYIVQSVWNITTEIIEVNLSAFVYRLFHEDFSSVDRTREIFLKQSVEKADESTSVISVHYALHWTL